MALPSGTIVVTDGLLDLSGVDDEIVAVLAHEAGHVRHRHGLRLLWQSSFIGVGLTWLLGDVSMLAAGASSALLQAKYSRDLEREADAYAADVLDRNDIPRAHFTRILQRLQESAEAKLGRNPGVFDYLSSHPLTSERIEAIQAD
jgi:Zn-dependent protease with chaperone function